LIPAPREALVDTAWCDRERIMQILANLLDNAIRFSPRGGTVRLEVRRQTGGLRFSVSDTGAGMSERDLAHCFERLWQGSGSAHGGGLGLWIARSLVEAHGGYITAESELGRGTTMNFFLPSSSAGLDARRQPSSQPPGSQSQGQSASSIPRHA
jgi:signal transduction histidine kinase